MINMLPVTCMDSDAVGVGNIDGARIKVRVIGLFGRFLEYSEIK